MLPAFLIRGPFLWYHYNSATAGMSCAAGSGDCEGPHMVPRESFTIIAQQGVLDWNSKGINRGIRNTH